MIDNEVPNAYKLNDMIDQAVDKKLNNSMLHEKLGRNESQVKALVSDYKEDHDHSTNQMLDLRGKFHILKSLFLRTSQFLT